ncbi:MAG: hypothetical protein PHZ02_04330 [Desulfocapsaceae bacterium]|nr:hypothetical protein [Desulfocapsaceae bacterium]
MTKKRKNFAQEFRDSAVKLTTEMMLVSLGLMRVFLVGGSARQVQIVAVCLFPLYSTARRCSGRAGERLKKEDSLPHQ